MAGTHYPGRLDTVFAAVKGEMQSVEDRTTAAEQVIAVIIDRYVRAVDELCALLYTADASRDRRYKNKYDEAVAYQAAGSPEPVDAALYPTLAAEAPARSISADALATMIITRATAFRSFGAAAEAARARISLETAGAADPEAHAAGIFAMLQATAASLA